jgi:hypothetical protein
MQAGLEPLMIASIGLLKKGQYRPGGVGIGSGVRIMPRPRSLVAESVLVKQQLLILKRSRSRSPNLRLSDCIVARVCALLCDRAG